MDKQIINYKDDFLEGSSTIYNYNAIPIKNYYIYCQIAGFQRIGSKYYNELKNAPMYMFNFTSGGSGCFLVDGKEYLLEKNDLVFVQNANHHILKPHLNNEWEFYFLHIYDNNLISDIFKDFTKRFGFILRNVDPKLVIPYVREIMNLLSKKDASCNSKVSVLIYQMLTSIIDFYQEKENNINKVDVCISDVVNFINNNYFKEISLEDILEKSSFSKNHLERLFKNKLHISMRDYIANLRLRRAQELLLTTNKSLKEIAEDCGLSEYRALHRLFKHNLGCTPSDYKNANINK